MRNQLSISRLLSLQALAALSILLSACSGRPVITLTTLPAKTATPAAVQASAGTIMVAFIQAGNLSVWNEATGQVRIIVNSGDVSRAKMSDDGQVIAFLRRTYAMQMVGPLEQHSLWAIDSDGGNPRELVSINTLRQRLSVDSSVSFGIAEMEWLPRTHRLVYSGTKIYDPGSDFHPVDEDVYLVDADTLKDTFLASAIDQERAVEFPWGQQLAPSPDGSQVAILHDAYLSFVNVDGSNLRQGIWSFANSGAHPFLARGVWTQDGRGLIVNAPVVSGELSKLNFAISRVPADGSPPDVIATIVNSYPSSVTFSPDGQYAAYRSEGESGFVWLTTPLPSNVGPLAVPAGYQFDEFINLHWSLAGDAYILDENNFWRLCPNAADGSQFCGDPFEIGERFGAIHWIDSQRFLFLHGPVLYLRRADGGTTPIATWPMADYFHPFTAAVVR